MWLVRTVAVTLVGVLGMGLQGIAGDRAGLAPLFGLLTVVPAAISVYLSLRPLRPDDAEAVRTQYARRFFAAVAIAQSALAVGYVGVFVAGPPWVLVLGTTVSLVALAFNAPTAGAIAREDGRLREQGSPVTLSEALEANST